MLFEVAAKAQVPPIKHVRIDVAPKFAQVGDQPNLAVEIGHRRNWKIHANARRASHLRERRDAHGGGHLETVSGRRMFAKPSRAWPGPSTDSSDAGRSLRPWRSRPLCRSLERFW